MLNSRPHPTRPLIKYGTLLLGALLAGCNSSSSLDPTPTQKQITIKRDKFGTPHVYANDTYGLFYGYGYSVATDRLFQVATAKAEKSNFSNACSATWAMVFAAF